VTVSPDHNRGWVPSRLCYIFVAEEVIVTAGLLFLFGL
jgi:hypothetical protein